jgi:hypothetical protein
MTTRDLKDDGGWVMLQAMVLMTITLVIGIGLLAVSDIQRSQATTERTNDASFTLAEGTLRSASAALGSSASTSADAPIKTIYAGTGTASCTSPAPAGSTLNAVAAPTTALGEEILKKLKNAFSTTGTVGTDGNQYASLAGQGSTFSVTLCPVMKAGSTVETVWDDSILTRSLTATQRVSNRAWVVARANVRGKQRRVVGQVQPIAVTAALPDKYAVATGRIATELSNTTGQVLSGDLLGTLLKGLVGSKRLIDGQSASGDPAKVGVRCALLNLLDGGGLCLSGSVAGVNGAVSALGLDPLGGLLGTNRSEQLKFWAVAGDQQLKSYTAEADSSGTHYTLADINANPVLGGTGPYKTLHRCLSTSDSSGKSVVIDEAPAAGCVLAGTDKAKILIVKKGKVIVWGAGGSTDPVQPTFKGVLYALNGETVDDTSKKSTNEVVRIENRGRVEGAVFVDGGGVVGIYPPPFDINSVLCGIPLVGTLTCTLTPVGSLLNVVLGLVGADAIVGALLPTLSYYTAIKLDQTVVTSASTTVPSGASVVPGTFKQVAGTK